MIPPLPILPILPLLNASLTSTLLNATVEPILDCWEQNPKGEQQFLSLTYSQCIQVLPLIPTRDKPLAPIIFARSDEVGYQVPEAWQSKTGVCGVLIDVRGDDLQETSTFGAIRDRAAALMRKCVIGPPHLGGTSFLGEVDGLVVQVFGALREGGVTAQI